MRGLAWNGSIGNRSSVKLLIYKGNTMNLASALRSAKSEEKKLRAAIAKAKRNAKSLEIIEARIARLKVTKFDIDFYGKY
jgi:hypothetical protein